MFADYLTRGVKAGLVAGLVFGLFMALVANPLVVHADELNHAAEGGHGHGHEAGETPWEWVGSYHLEPGTYTYTFHEGPDPAMHLAVLRTDASGQESIHTTEGTAEDLYGRHDSATSVADGERLSAAPDTLYDLQFAESGATTFTIEITQEGQYVLFTEHAPSEFDATLTSESGATVHPDVTEGGGAHGHEAEGGDGGEEHHDTAVSMAVNKAVSVLSSGLWAVLLGGVFFGIGYYVLEPALPGTGATKSYVLGGAGFVTVSGAPWLVLPPVSPGAQQSIPVETRLLLYGGMMVAGALTCLLAVLVYDRLHTLTNYVVAVVGAVIPFSLLAVPTVLAPTNTVQGALPAELQAGLTGLFVFGQVLLWLLLSAAHAKFLSTEPTESRPPMSNRDSTVTAD